MAKTTVKNKSMRVGMLVTGALVILMIGLFFIGAEQKIFARKNEYQVRLENVTGLADGNPVKMSGVTIGVIRDILLPRDPKERNVEITLMIDRKYADRVRQDSRARLKKLGLLAGDSYIDITPGTLRFNALEPGAMIPSQRQTNVDQLISSGEDLVDNLVQISYSMKNILGRVDRGEGLIGELTTAPETKQRITDTFLTTLNKTNAALTHMESGKGTVGKLLYDDKYADELTASISGAARSLQAVTVNVQRSLESGTGVLPALLNDPQGRQQVTELVANLKTASTNLAGFTETMQKGEGLIPRLLNDKPYGDQAMAEFTLLIQQLNEAVRKVNAGEGTAGKLIADPSVYESINDILIGINESKMLRWLIRNRQQSGIDKRFDEQQNAPAPAPRVPPPATAPEVPVLPPTDTTGTAVITTTTTTTATTTTTGTQPPR
jgi:phospholipid/cholesterol/gamma-HCH transport system substrate-binding protein